MDWDAVPQRGASYVRNIGVIEVYMAYGLHLIEVERGKNMIDACFEAHDIWEAEGEKVRVRVIKWEDGFPTCILHLPPVEDE